MTLAQPYRHYLSQSHALNQASPSSPKADRFRRHNLSQALVHDLDRVNVLGDDATYGHTGCVNALSWAKDGELLLSGGDDTTVRIWGLDSADTSQEYPFVCRSVIQTGHRANIFSAQMMPHSSRIVTVAGDKQVRVFDIGQPRSTAPDGSETVYSSRQACSNILQCHEDRVKRIVTEHSSDLFLTVGEDGTVRQHDLRMAHDCRGRACPTPLVKVNHTLSTLALSPLTPYQFVVAGEAPYGYLFDRRHVGRFLREEWGVPPLSSDKLTTCVRRFGRSKQSSNERRSRSEHVTGARMSAQNGHELLLSYSADAVYLYSTADEPEFDDSSAALPSSVLPSNTKRRKIDDFSTVKIDLEPGSADMIEVDHDSSTSRSADHHDGTHGETDNGVDREEEEEESYLEVVDLNEIDEAMYQPHIPIVLPRRRFVGARNVETTKDVNFLGPNDEFITSGSDDGNFFIWRKATGGLHGIYEGDGSVVNIVEGHPYLPLVATSGIDTTVKLFAPATGSSEFSRTDNAELIIDANTRLSRSRTIRYNLATLLAEARSAMEAGEGSIGIPECRAQ